MIGICNSSVSDRRVILEIVNELRERSGRVDIVAAVMKVNGGSNSGHTVDGLKLNLLPGGVADPLVPYLAVGCGVVADPRKFIWECIFTFFQLLTVSRRRRGKNSFLYILF